jgi:hypothetical protein
MIRMLSSLRFDVDMTWLGYILEDLPASLKAVGLEGCPVGRREQHLVDYETLSVRC